MISPAPTTRYASSLPITATFAALWFVLTTLPIASNADANAMTIKLVEVAPGLHVFAARHSEANAQNMGAMGNAAVVIGADAVAVIDTGGSRRFGEQLLSAILELTDRPIRFVINTHVHPDHVLGNAAFASPGVKFVGHHKLPRAMAQRGPFYLESFARLVGPSFAGTTLVAPDVTVSDKMTIDLGQRLLTLTAYQSAHTDNDLSVFDHATGTLIAGDLVFMERLPVVDASLLGWVTVGEQLRSQTAMAGTPMRHVVPGHGPAIAKWPDALIDQQRYLKRLLTDTRNAVARDTGITAALREVAPEERNKWLLFDAHHPRNVTASYAELEWE